MREKSPEPSNWVIVVRLIQAAFCEGALAEDCARQTVVLILKGEGNFCVIIIMEVLWKMVTGGFNRILAASIHFHDMLHGL